MRRLIGTLIMVLLCAQGARADFAAPFPPAPAPSAGPSGSSAPESGGRGGVNVGMVLMVAVPMANALITKPSADRRWARGCGYSPEQGMQAFANLFGVTGGIANVIENERVLRQCRRYQIKDWREKPKTLREHLSSIDGWPQ